MNPYSRFQVVSGAVSGALVLAGFGLLTRKFVGPSWDAQTLLTLAGLVSASVTIWFSMNQNLLPLVMKHSGLRKAVLGTQHIEGTWLQAEKSADGNRMAVIDIRPGEGGFTLTGYALDEDFEVVSNVSIEFSKLTWPNMSFKYRNTLVDFDDPNRDGFGELQFELSNGSPRRYNGYCKLTNGHDRFAIEGVRITEADDLDLLASLEGREDLVEKYWELFFERDQRRAERIADRKSRREARKAERARKVEAVSEPERTVAVGEPLELQQKVEAAFVEDPQIDARRAPRRKAG